MRTACLAASAIVPAALAACTEGAGTDELARTIEPGLMIVDATVAPGGDAGLPDPDPDASPGDCDDETIGGYICARATVLDPNPFPPLYYDEDNGVSLAAVQVATGVRSNPTVMPGDDCSQPVGVNAMRDHCEDTRHLIEGYVPAMIFVPYVGWIEVSAAANVCSEIRYGTATIDCVRLCARVNEAGTLCGDFGGTGSCCATGACADDACACSACD